MSDNLIGATTAIFIVSLSIAVNEPVEVAWSTRDGTAKSGVDYKAANGVVSFLPGETRKQIEVIVYGQNVSPTSDKNFFINLMPPTNAVLGTTLIEAVIKVEDESGVPVTSVIVAQGKRGLKGDPGLSAYEQAVLMGYDGTLEDWMQEQADAAAAAQRASDYAANANAAAAKAENAATAASFLGNIFPTPEAGVDPVTGVGNGAYYNVRSTEDDSYLVEYQNIGGVPTPSGKSYPSAQAIVEVQQIVAAVGETVATVDVKLKRENISVWDFFTPDEYVTYKAAPAAFDASRPIQEFFNYIVANDTRVAYCSGDFLTSQALVLGAGSAKTKLVIGNATFKALNAVDTVFNINAGSDFAWLGMITATGTGSAGSNSYNSRTCRVGVQISSPGKNSPRNKYTAITANNFKEFGVFVNGVGSLSSLGFVRSSNCGSGKKTAGYSLTSSFSNATNSGSSGSVSQLTTLDVDTLPSSDLASANTNSLPLQAIINGTPYYIQSIDRVNNKISVFPWLEPSITSGTLTYMFGGAVCVNGGDSSVLGIEMIDAVNCGAALVSGALYPPVVERIVSQVNGAALVLGQNPASAMIGGSVGTLYCENNDFDLIRVTRANLSFNILNTVAFNLDKVAFSCAARATSGNYSSYAHLRGISLFSNGVPLEYQRAAIGGISPALDVTDENNSDFVYFGGSTSSTITINIPNDARASLFGIYKRRVIVYGSAAGSRPSPITFTLEDSVNYTINGTTSVLFDSFEGFAVFEVIYDRSNKRFFISQVSNKGASTTGTTSVSYDPPSIPANGIETTTATLAGAAVGDIVQAAFSRYDAGIEISAVVSSANTVTVRFKNTSAAPIDLASGTLTVKRI